jgi:hypothetical protein
MFKRLGCHLEGMVLAIMLWLCGLPLVALIVIPLFGLKVAGIVALVLFFVATVICWVLCSWQVFKDQVSMMK